MPITSSPHNRPRLRHICVFSGKLTVGSRYVVYVYNRFVNVCDRLTRRSGYPIVCIHHVHNTIMYAHNTFVYTLMYVHNRFITPLCMPITFTAQQPRSCSSSSRQARCPQRCHGASRAPLTCPCPAAASRSRRAPCPPAAVAASAA